MTYTGLGLLVGAGIDQQPHAVRVTMPGGPNQRRPSFLRIEFAATAKSGAIATSEKERTNRDRRGIHKRYTMTGVRTRIKFQDTTLNYRRGNIRIVSMILSMSVQCNAARKQLMKASKSNIKLRTRCGSLYSMLAPSANSAMTLSARPSRAASTN